MKALIILSILIIIIAVLLVIPTLSEFEISAENGKFKHSLIFRYGFIKFTLSPSDKKKNGKKTIDKSESTKTDNEKKFSYDSAMQGLKRAKYIYTKVKDDIFHLLSYAGKHSITFKEIRTSIEFDFEDPMHTGIATGVVNGIVYNMLALLDNTVKVKKHAENIRPLFRNSNYYSIDIFGIVRLKNVHIMVILIKAFKLYLKIKKYNKHLTID